MPIKPIYRILSLCLCIYLSSCSSGSDSATPKNDACGIIGLKSIQTKIVNGTACADGRSPIVMISTTDLGLTNSDICTGTLISANAVITAGHCVPLEPAGVSVVVQGRNVSAREIRVHPQYRVDQGQGLVYFDVAIIFLKEAISLPTLPIVASQQLNGNEIFSIYGYGLDEKNRSGQLRSGQILATSITPTHLFHDFDGIGSNTCGGDSGGPLVFTFTNESGITRSGLVGLTSTGTDLECRPGDSASYTNLQNPEILSFILGNVRAAQTI